MSKYLGLPGLCAFVAIMGAARDERPSRISARQAVTQPAGVPSTRPAVPHEPRRLGPPQPSRVRVDVLRLTLPYEKGVDFSLDQVKTEGSSNKDLLAALGKLGEAVLMYRFDETIDLAGETTLSKAQQEPVVDSVFMVPRGLAQPSMRYVDTLCQLTVLGQWGGDQRSEQEADVSVKLRLNYIESSSLDLGGDIKAPVIVRVDNERSLRVTSKRAVLSALLGPFQEYPMKNARKGEDEEKEKEKQGEKEPRQFRACIVRLQLDRLTEAK
jgi:hypothetical protein